MCAFNRRKPLAASCMAAAVQRIAIEAERHRFTFRQTRRTVLVTFSMMLVQASERRSAFAPTSFGDYGIVRFIAPFRWPRRAAIDRVANDIKLAVEHHKPDRVSVISRSFGTYVFLDLLENLKQLKFDRVIFCGSVIRDNVFFGDGLGRFEPPLLNEVGGLDWLPVIAKSAGWGYGAAGSVEINNPLVETRWHMGLRHSDLLKAAFCRKFWLPFLLSGKVIPGGKAVPLPLSIRLIAKFPLKWIIALTVISMVLWTGDMTIRQFTGISVISSTWCAAKGSLYRFRSI